MQGIFYFLQYNMIKIANAVKNFKILQYLKLKIAKYSICPIKAKQTPLETSALNPYKFLFAH